MSCKNHAACAHISVCMLATSNLLIFVLYLGGTSISAPSLENPNPPLKSGESQRPAVATSCLWEQVPARMSHTKWGKVKFWGAERTDGEEVASRYSTPSIHQVGCKVHTRRGHAWRGHGKWTRSRKVAFSSYRDPSSRNLGTLCDTQVALRRWVGGTECWFLGSFDNFLAVSSWCRTWCSTEECREIPSPRLGEQIFTLGWHLGGGATQRM